MDSQYGAFARCVYASELLPLLNHLGVASSDPDFLQSLLAYEQQQQRTPDERLVDLKRAALIAPHAAGYGGPLPPLEELMAWQESWLDAARTGDHMHAALAYLRVPLHSSAPPHLQQQQQALLSAVAEMMAAMRAPPDAAAAHACVLAMHQLTEDLADGVRGGWYTVSSVPALHNLDSPFVRVMTFLSYPPRYATRRVAGPDERPSPAGLTHPASDQHWLHSVGLPNSVYKAAQLKMGGAMAAAARRFTQSGVHAGPLGTMYGCYPLLQTQISDLAWHNSGTGTYSFQLPDGTMVHLEGRLPSRPEARSQHAEVLGLMDETPAIRDYVHVICESGTEGRDLWLKRRDVLDITPVARAVTAQALRQAGLGHVADSLPFLGLKDACVALWVPPSGKPRLALTPDHPCVNEARRDGGASAGQVQALACITSAVLGPGRFPTDDLMPMLGESRQLRHVEVPPSRVYLCCHACEFSYSADAVARGEPPTGRMPCEGRCFSTPLAYQGGRLDNHRITRRLYRACQRGSFSYTELQFILFPHRLPAGANWRLQGKRGRDRDAELTRLMGEATTAAAEREQKGIAASASSGSEEEEEWEGASAGSGGEEWG